MNDINVFKAQAHLYVDKNLNNEGLRRFHISDIISVYSGRLVSMRHVEGIYDLLDYMTNDTLCTHQLSRGGNEVNSYLIEAFPWLGDLEPHLDALRVSIEALDESDMKKINDDVNFLREIIWSIRRRRNADLVEGEPYDFSIPETLENDWKDLLEQQRQITTITTTRRYELIKSWVQSMSALYGEWHVVHPIHFEDHEVIDPAQELEDMGFSPDQIISVEVDDQEPPSPYGDINWKGGAA